MQDGFRAWIRGAARMLFALGLCALAGLASPASARAQRAAPSSGRDVLGRMHAAYDGTWYRSLAFAQKTVRFTPAGERRVQSWREYLRWTPERGTELRIDIGDAANGNSIRYTADSSWRFAGGTLTSHDANGNAFLPLIEGVYVQPVERTAAELVSTRVDLSKVSTQTWNGQPAWVVGTRAAGDTLSPQFWVDTARKVLVRMILKVGAGTDALDIRLDDYVPVPGGMLATRVTMLSKGSPMQIEEYADWRTGSSLPDSTFSLKPGPPDVLSRVDHLVYATPDLTRGIAELERLLGVRATPGGQHMGLGTRNALIALGPSTYIEIIAPDPDQPTPPGPRRFGIDGLTHSRLVTWAAKGTDLERLRADAVRDGIPIGKVQPGGRRRPDGVELKWQSTDSQANVADGIVPFFIDWGASPHPAQTAAKGATLVALRAEHPDAPNVRRMLERLGVPLDVTNGAQAALVATIDTPRGRVELR